MWGTPYPLCVVDLGSNMRACGLGGGGGGDPVPTTVSRCEPVLYRSLCTEVRTNRIYTYSETTYSRNNGLLAISRNARLRDECCATTPFLGTEERGGFINCNSNLQAQSVEVSPLNSRHVSHLVYSRTHNGPRQVGVSWDQFE